MMRALVAVLFFLAQPFWEARPPEKWTDQELDQLRHNSPWAQSVGPEPLVVVYLATALPIVQADEEARARSRKPLPQPDVDYTDYVRDNADEQFVLAITYPTLHGLGSAEEELKMEQETQMVIGRKTYNITGSFPPTPSDPVLRLVFPREVKLSDKSVAFHLYLPGLPFPEREAEFRVKDMAFKGKLEM